MIDADDPWLNSAEAAERAGMKPVTWRSYVSRRRAPAADDPDSETPRHSRRPRWRTSTVDAFRDNRLGQGLRTDLINARAERARELADELADPAPAPNATLQGWLGANHRALLAVAEVLVDHRDELVAASPDCDQDILAGSIDQAGKNFSREPSRALASAVTYALFLLRPNGPVQIIEDAELRQILTHRQHLRTEYDAVRTVHAE